MLTKSFHPKFKWHIFLIFIKLKSYKELISLLLVCISAVDFAQEPVVVFEKKLG
jgi:hypothetical protein